VKVSIKLVSHCEKKPQTVVYFFLDVQSYEVAIHFTGWFGESEWDKYFLKRLLLCLEKSKSETLISPGPLIGSSCLGAWLRSL